MDSPGLRLSKLSVVSALLAAFVLLLGQRGYSGREALADELAVQANLVGANAGAAVAFSDEWTAEEILSALSRSPVVEEAALYRADGSRLAAYRSHRDGPGALPPRAPRPGQSVDWDGARVAAPVLVDARVVGTIALRANLDSVYRDLARFLGGLVAITAAATLLAWLASLGLRQRMARAEEELEHLALFDQTTALPNRQAFDQTLEQTVARHQRNGGGSALLYLDVSGFKKVNDMFGHHVGDYVLKEVGDRLRKGVRGADVVARLGGDEFGVILMDIHSPDDAARIAGHLIETVALPIETGRHPAYVGLSIGLAMIPQDGDSAERLLQHADLAMFQSKQAGRNNIQFFSDRIGSAVRHRLEVETALRTALAENQLYLVYQPQVDAAGGALRGVEALVRWRHPEKGIIPPAEFIPVAEESGLILELGRRVLALACTDIVALRDAGCRTPPVAVNISARQFSGSHLTQEVATALMMHGLTAADLEIELTESVVMDRPEENEPILAELSASGLRIAIDDFGTGYSSLSYLKRLPVDKLKIDRSFVGDLPANAESEAIVAAIIQMAHALKLRVVAEGVETEAQAACLRTLGCDIFQGYLTGRPMERDALATLLQA